MLLSNRKTWCFAENIDTDQILPGYAMAEPEHNLGNFALAGSEIPDFAKIVQAGDIIVAGSNFGCGSSREQAPVALQQAGVSLIIAKSYARIFRRNAINIGLPVLEADLAVKPGEMLSVNVQTGEIFKNNKLVATAKPLSATTLATLEAGGLIKYVQAQLRASGELA